MDTDIQQEPILHNSTPARRICTNEVMFRDYNHNKLFVDPARLNREKSIHPAKPKSKSRRRGGI